MIDYDLSASVFLAIQIVVVVVVALCGAVVAIHSRRRMSDVQSVLAGAAATLAMAIAIIMGAAIVGVGPLGLLRLLYLALTIALPLASLGVLTARLLGRTAMARRGLALASLGLLAAPLGIYATWIEPNRLTLEETALVVSRERVGRNAVRLGILADLQTDSVGEHERAAVDLLMKQAPDIILIPGDLFEGTDAQWTASRDALRELLQRLHAPGGVYFARGDADNENILKLLKETRVRTLRNEIAQVRVGDRNVTIGGVDKDARGIVKTLEETAGTDDIRILLSHWPDHALELGDRTRVDLTVSGHTHGGQIAVPGFGPIITNSAVPREVAGGGLHWMGGRAIYVSRGVGMLRADAPPARFNCPPEISVVTLVSSR